MKSIVFSPGASAFTISTDGFALTLSGEGAVNNSGVAQNFTSAQGPESFNFTNSAAAGDATYTLTSGGSGGIAQFFDTATAANATFDNLGGDNGSGELFFDSSTAGNGTFFNHAHASMEERPTSSIPLMRAAARLYVMADPPAPPSKASCILGVIRVRLMPP